MDVLTTMQAPLKRSSPRLPEKWRSVPPRRPSSLAVPVLSWPSRQSIRHKLHTCQPASLKKVNGMVFDESREIVHGDVVLGLGELFANYKLCWEDHCDEDTPFVSSSYDWLMKFMMLFGFFTLHGPQQAAAMLDLTSSLQSAPYLSDLGDISTGFSTNIFL